MTEHNIVESGDPNDRTYWFNTVTGDVEHGRVSPGPDRLGPFATAAEAEKAEQTVRDRAEMWKNEDASDDAW